MNRIPEDLHLWAKRFSKSRGTTLFYITRKHDLRSAAIINNIIITLHAKLGRDWISSIANYVKRPSDYVRKVIRENEREKEQEILRIKRARDNAGT